MNSSEKQAGVTFTCTVNRGSPLAMTFPGDLSMSGKLSGCQGAGFPTSLLARAEL